ncbi:hypothetical protein AB3N04_04760 [Alkalihalophilus sp. As8PL]|uniref:Uncharacterized protein n=1 Tax=Alkalihalophilus sp. As8PL TaxID=3237103 RepID=A0AB39BVD3_9BACI
MAYEFTHLQLKKMISGVMIESAFPYDTNDVQEVERHINSLYHELRKSGIVECFPEFNHYGSGYSSFVEFFIPKRNSKTLIKEVIKPYFLLKEYMVEGIVLYVSRLAPIAVWGFDERAYRIKKWKDVIVEDDYVSHSFLYPTQHDFMECPSKCQEEWCGLKEKVEEYGYQFLPKEYLNLPLPFEATIATCFTEKGHYKVFDSCFYWED